MGLLLLSSLYALPNVFLDQPVLQITPVKTDLSVKEKLKAAIQQSLSEIPYQLIESSDPDHTLSLLFSNVETQLAAKEQLGALLGTDYLITPHLMPTTPRWLQALGAHPMKLGLDLRGGVHFTLEIDMQSLQREHLHLSPQGLRQLKTQALAQTFTVLQNRINELGIAEPLIQTKGEDRIVVELPGVQDITRAEQILGSTATLEFRLVDTQTDGVESTSSILPPYYSYHNTPVKLKESVILTGKSITIASQSTDELGKPTVSVHLNGADAAHFHHITRTHKNHWLAIVMLEAKATRIISIARITEALGRQFQISGLSEVEAANLALLLRAGALPAPISILEQTTIGPQLGSNNIQLGQHAILGGFLFAAGFMALYYGRFGWIANITLLINLILLTALLSLLKMTLTLPGMAGILLTVVIAIDAEVLIFERIREELQRGASPKTSIVLGYQRAWTTILEANLSTLMIAFSLFFIGTNAIKGFALTLILGTLTSLLSAVSFSRALVHHFYGRTKKLKRLAIGLRGNCGTF